MRLYVVTLDEARYERARANAADYGLEAEALAGVAPEDVPDEWAEEMEFYPNLATLVRTGTISWPGMGRELERWTDEALDTITPEAEAQGVADYRRKKAAIRMAMQKAAEHLAEHGGGLVTQDDVRWSADPTQFAAPFVVYSGETFPGHRCPRAWFASANTARQLADDWKWRGRGACKLWEDTVGRYAFIPPWTIAQPETGREGR